MNHPEETPSSRRSPFGLSPKGILLLILLGSAVLRVWGLDFGLPQRFHPDEPIVVSRAQYGVATNDWNPRLFHWPSLQIYILGLEYEVWYGVQAVMGSLQSEEYEEIPSSDRFIAYALRAPGGFYYLGRLTTMLFGVGVVWLVFRLARRFLSVQGALAASAIVALDPIMIRHSRYITPDIPAEFFFLAALFFIDRLYVSLRNTRGGSDEETSERTSNPLPMLIWAGVMIGLGTGTKYPVGVLAAPLALTVLIAPSAIGFGKRILYAAAGCVMVGLAFLIATPYAALDFPKFWYDIRTVSAHVQAGHIGMEATGGIWIASLRRIVVDSGWAWFAAGAIGIATLVIGRFRRVWPVMLSMVFILVGLAPLDVFSDRYLIPLIPFWAIGIGTLFSYIRPDMSPKNAFFVVPLLLVTTLIGWLESLEGILEGVAEWLVSILMSALFVILTVAGSRRRRHDLMTAALLIAFLALIGSGLMRSVTEARDLTLPDTREFALGWVEMNIPPHSVIIEEQGGPDLNSADLIPLVPEPWYYIREIAPLFSRGTEFRDPLDILLSTRPGWVITSSQVRHRYMREGAEEEFPGVVAAFWEYYRLIDNYLVEEARFTPGNGVVGNEIVIYSVPEGFWNRVIVGEATVGEVLERDEEERVEEERAEGEEDEE
jgi:4-amino-4-deoxy-L-arabinose transferase-like glycosyltransferase